MRVGGPEIRKEAALGGQGIVIRKVPTGLQEPLDGLHGAGVGRGESIRPSERRGQRLATRGDLGSQAEAEQLGCAVGRAESIISMARP